MSKNLHRFIAVKNLWHLRHFKNTSNNCYNWYFNVKCLFGISMTAVKNRSIKDLYHLWHFKCHCQNVTTHISMSNAMFDISMVAVKNRPKCHIDVFGPKTTFVYWLSKIYDISKTCQLSGFLILAQKKRFNQIQLSEKPMHFFGCLLTTFYQKILMQLDCKKT